MNLLKNFKKKKSNISVLNEHYGPAPLPHYGDPDLAGFITSDYTSLRDGYIEEHIADVEQKLTPIIENTDEHSLGSILDPYIDSDMNHVKAQFVQECAMHDLQSEHIRKSRTVRMGEIDRELEPLTQHMEELIADIEPLKGKRSQWQFHIGKTRIGIGGLVTVAAMVVDAFLNFSFLQTILLSNIFLLALTVVCLSVMSDGSMCVLGSLLSRRREDFMPKLLFRILCGGLIGAFVLSVIVSVMVRFGSMDATYGAINAAGEFVGKDSYSLGEWGVSLATAFVTTVTGIISMVFSMDDNAHLEARRIELEAELAALTRRYSELMAERHALELEEDPSVRDLACREAARHNIHYLRITLKAHMRKLLTLKQKDAAYTDAMSESAQALLTNASPEEQPAEDTEDAPKPSVNNSNLTALELKEAV